MAKMIIEMARERKAMLYKNPSEAGQNATLAIAAIAGGIKSPAWRTYMMQFIEQNPPGEPVEPKQLARLLGEDGTLGNVKQDRHRAYLVANATCGIETREGTTLTVGTIDETLPTVGDLDSRDYDVDRGRYIVKPKPKPTKTKKKMPKSKTQSKR